MRNYIPLAAILVAMCSTSAMANPALAKSKNCMSCHTMDKKLVGPSFQEIAQRNKGKPASALVQAIMSGSKGKYGLVPMPANTQVSAQEAASLASWILATP